MTYPLPFRVGTTSYIRADDILANVRFLADKTQDVELLMFDSPDTPEALPARETVAELMKLACVCNLSYTVHLPLDLRLGASGPTGEASRLSARRLIERTQDLQPWAYIVHLDGRGRLPSTSERSKTKFAAALRNWQDRAAESLTLLAEAAGGTKYLAVENLEGMPFEQITPILEQVPASRCVDIGHLWLDGIDPLPHLDQALPCLRVVHLHGVGTRDHMSLHHISPERLDIITAWLPSHFSGVLTLEVFGEADFHSSRKALEESLRRTALRRSYNKLRI